MTTICPPPADQYLDVVGLSVTGDDNDVEIDGGINITHSEDPLDGTSADITGISVSGNSTVTLNGHSTIDTNTVVGGHVVLAAGQQRRLPDSG
ncbi:putative surface-exposed virulence protein BigA [Salmonella enterica subsp. enterica]|uniref:Putative surface-exposed virulence protein BigA n=1 Tax=Salmonella enterica I TaxID=59201 RepID=A0A3S4J9U2_SALET|nr:putative surface-exposed virulence protein BigA [Salmonella enterica subsp. enterica]